MPQTGRYSGGTVFAQSLHRHRRIRSKRRGVRHSRRCRKSRRPRHKPARRGCGQGTPVADALDKSLVTPSHFADAGVAIGITILAADRREDAREQFSRSQAPLCCTRIFSASDFAAIDVGAAIHATHRFFVTRTAVVGTGTQAGNLPSRDLLAKHSLMKVLPSTPHTGSNTSGQPLSSSSAAQMPALFNLDTRHATSQRTRCCRSGRRHRTRGRTAVYRQCPIHPAKMPRPVRPVSRKQQCRNAARRPASS